MSTIRDFRREDASEVAELWVKTFCSGTPLKLEPVRTCFEEIFFSNPWRTPDLPSLVYQDDQRRISGFIGVVPRLMKFKGRTIQIAVATQFMVDKSRNHPFAAFELLRRLFAGPQELTLSDGANDSSLRAWKASGGDASTLYCSVWTKLLRPTRYVMRLCEERNFFAPVAKLSMPASWVIDAAAVRIRRGPYWLEPPDTIDEDLNNEMLLYCLHRFGERALKPEYNADSLDWLLDQASRQKLHGNLQKRVVRTAKGEILGWYLCYLQPGGLGQVLQFGGSHDTAGKVLHHLFYRAWQEGAVSISGQMEPRFARELARKNCQFTWTGSVAVHSRNSDILSAISRGDAFLTRLEGEWWMRFCDLSRQDRLHTPGDMKARPAFASQGKLQEADHVSNSPT